MGRKKDDGRGRMGGRQKGTPNKATSTAREWLAALIDRNRPQIERDIMELTPMERVRIFERLLQYVVPRKQSVQAAVDISMLTDEQLDAVVSELTKNVDYGDEAGQGKASDAVGMA